MIKNSKQASFARETLKKLQTERTELLTKKDELSELRYQTSLDTYDSLIEELIEDINIYENLVTNGYHCFKNISMENLGDLLISARLAQGLSQKDLANSVGIQEQQIQRYELTDYESASLVRLLEIADALNIKLIYKNVEILGKHPTFALPKNIQAESVDQAESFLRSKCSLVFP